MLQVKAPSGHFFIDPDAGVPVVLIAGGIGITPMMSMLRWCLAEQPRRPVHLFYGLRNGDEHAFKQALEDTGGLAPALHAARGLQPPRARRRAGARLPACRPRGRRPAAPHAAAWPPPVLRLRAAADDADPGAGAGRVGRAASTTSTSRRSARRPCSFRRLPASPPRRWPPASTCTSVAPAARWSGTGQDAIAARLRRAPRHRRSSRAAAPAAAAAARRACSTARCSYEHTPDHDVAAGHCLLCVGRPPSALVLEA